MRLTAKRDEFEVPRLTYRDFLEVIPERVARLYPANQARKKRSKLKRAIELHMRANGLTGDSRVGAELAGRGSDFDNALRRTIEAAPTQDLAKMSRPELKTVLREWARQELRARQTAESAISFADRLTSLMDSEGWSCRQLAVEIRMSHTAVRNWKVGSSLPDRSKHLDEVQRLEEILSCRPGFLTEKIPDARHAAPAKSGRGRSVDRRLAHHLEGVPEELREEATLWVKENILTAPKESFKEDGTEVVPREPYRMLLPDEGLRSPRTGTLRLQEQIKQLRQFKTAKEVPEGQSRNTAWGPYAADKSIGDLLRFCGAFVEQGMPPDRCDLSLLISYEAIKAYCDWYVERRGALTRTVLMLLESVSGLLRPETGFIHQRPDLFAPLEDRVQYPSDFECDRALRDWAGHCEAVRKRVLDRLKRYNEGTFVDEVLVQGRDPFEAILPILDADDPLSEAYKIVREIRKRLPNKTHNHLSWALAQRDLVAMRLGFELAFRVRNFVEMQFYKSFEKRPRASWLTRHKKMDIGYNQNGLLEVRAARNAFKNSYGRALKDMSPNRPMPIDDNDLLYTEFNNYTQAREYLLNGAKDPGTLFVKNMRSRASEPASMSRHNYYEMIASIVRRYGIYNPYTNRGAIRGLRPTGPHALFRDVKATFILKTGGRDTDAADALFDSVEMIHNHYGRFLPQDRNLRVRREFNESFYARVKEGSDEDS